MIQIEVYNRTSVPKEEWNTFVESSNNGTLFSLADFYDYHSEPKDVQFYVCKKKSDWVAVCVGSTHNGVFKSPFAASYGGLVFKNDVRFEDQEHVLTQFEQFLKNQGCATIQFVQAPLCYNQKVDQSIDFLMKYHGYQEDQTLISSVIYLRDYSEESTSFKATQQIQKAEKLGIEIRQLTDLNQRELFYQILLQNKAKFNLRPTHSFLELEKLLSLFPKKILLYGAFLKNVLIAGAVNFVATNQTILAFYIALDYDYSSYSPTNLLIHKFNLDAKNKGYKWLDLGVSMETDTNNPMDPRRSLIFFKEHFGSKGQVRSRFVKSL